MNGSPISLDVEPKALSQESVGAAFYPGKEDWKATPGNRYTAEELRAMDRNWDFRLTNPAVSNIRQAN